MRTPKSAARTKVMVRNMARLEEDEPLDESAESVEAEPGGTAVAPVTVVAKNPMSEVAVFAVVLQEW